MARATPRQVHVTLGDYVINSAVEPLPAYTFGVRSIHVHPYFKFTPQADRFDVAVLTLERPVHYMPHIGKCQCINILLTYIKSWVNIKIWILLLAPICLPDKNEDFLGKFGWAAGWGALNPGSRLRPKTLQAVDVPVIDNRWDIFLDLSSRRLVLTTNLTHSMKDLWEMASFKRYQCCHISWNVVCRLPKWR